MSHSSSTFHHQGSWLPSFSELTESIAHSAADVAPSARHATPPGGRIPFRSPRSHDGYESPHYYSSPFTAGPWSPLNPDPLSANRDPFHCTDSPRTPSSASIAPTTDYNTIHVNTSDTESGGGMVQIPAKLNYTEALEAIANSAFALYDFARRCTADCRTGNDESMLLVKLPSKRVVTIMVNNSDVIKKRTDDIKSARKWFEESTSGSRSRKSHHGSSADTMQKPGMGRRRIREIGVDAHGKKTIPARNAAGKCYNCDCTESTEWRKGPEGARTLCNRCGLQYSKRNMPVRKRSRHSLTQPEVKGFHS